MKIMYQKIILTAAAFVSLGSLTMGREMGPKPQFVRQNLISMDGTWDFAFDGRTILSVPKKDHPEEMELGPENGGELGESEKWYLPNSPGFNRNAMTINVPYPYETAASGIGKSNEIHTVVWYRKHFETPVEFSNQKSLLLNFGSSDYDTKVWVNGKPVGRHLGGYTSFQFDIGRFLSSRGALNTIVVRVFDDVRDPHQRKGKQRPLQGGIFYKHDTGIGRSVFMEETSNTYLKDVQVSWIGDKNLLEFIPEVSPTSLGTKFRVKIYEKNLDGSRGPQVASQETPLGKLKISVGVEIKNPKLWFPKNKFQPDWRPNLYDLEYEIVDGNGLVKDKVHSYTGLRTLRQTNGAIYINDQKIKLVGVLNQQYREDTQLSGTETTIQDELRKAIKSGYNFTRLHQSFDPRTLALADRLGIFVSAEIPSAELITPETADQALSELSEMVVQVRNHPSLIQIDDINESWGLPYIDKRDWPYRDLYSKNPQAAQTMMNFNIDYINRSLATIRKLIKSGHSQDGIVVGFGMVPDENGNSYGVLTPGNDGWDDTGKGNSTQFHRYDVDGRGLLEALIDIPQHLEMGQKLPPADARLAPDEELKHPYHDEFGSNRTPVVLSEFGGKSFVDQSETVHPQTWGYAGIERNKRKFALSLLDIFSAAAQINLAGYVYTQLKRTGYEMNGTLDIHGAPILPLKMMNAIVTIGQYPKLDQRATKVKTMINNYFDQEEKSKPRGSSGCSTALKKVYSRS